MKKNKMKRLIVAVMMCVMILGTSAVAYAATRDVHVCAFSYMRTECYSTSHISYHTYEDVNGNTQTCEVYVENYRKLYKCACGAIEYRDYYNLVKHSGQCGQ